MRKALNKPSFSGSRLSGIPVLVLLKHTITGIESKLSHNSRQLGVVLHCASQLGHEMCSVPIKEAAFLSLPRSTTKLDRANI